MAASDPRFGRRMQQLRNERGVALRALASRVFLSKSRLHELETGAGLPTAEQARLIDNALRADGELVDLLLTITSPQGGAMTAGLEFAPSVDRAVQVASSLWRADLNRRDVLRRAVFTAAMFVPPALRALASVDEHPTGCGREPVEDSDVDTVRRMTATLRGVDNAYGGGQVRETALRFLVGDVAPMLHHGRYSERVGRDLLSATAELSLLTGWCTHDTGMHGLAQRYLIQALRLARGVGDLPLAAEVVAAMSHQAAYLGAGWEAVELARAAGRLAAACGVDAIRAEAEVLAAHGHAVAGDEGACAVALDRAERTLDQADRTGDPQWIGYFDEAYLSAKFGHCFTALGRGDLATRFAGRSLDMDQRYARGRQFNLALLARAHAQAGELEQAAAVGVQAVRAARTLRSARSADYLRDLADRLARHCGLPAVQDFRDRVRPVLQASLRAGQ